MVVVLSLFLSDVRIGSAQQPIGSLCPSRLQLFFYTTTTTTTSPVTQRNALRTGRRTSFIIPKELWVLDTASRRSCHQQDNGDDGDRSQT